MDIIKKYFDFKLNNLVDYTLSFFDDKKDVDDYIKEYLNTYINCYYFHITDTYYEDEVKNFDDNIIFKELKGKKLELLDDLIKSEEPNKPKKEKMIKDCYNYAFIAIILDLTNFTYCDTLNDYRNLLIETLVKSKNLLNPNDEVIEKLSIKLKDSITKERKFFVGLRNDTFNINYYAYRDNNHNYHVELEYNIQQLEKNYSNNILEKNYKNGKISYEKFIATTNLVKIDLLNKIIRRKEIKKYFIDCPISSIDNKETFENIITSFDNKRIINNVVFIVDYNDYVSKKSLFKNLNEYEFAVKVDFSRVIVIEKRLDELDKNELFKYILIDGIKKEDSKLVENFVMHGKEMFMNELNMM